jgi:L-fuconolactonase
MKIDAHQHFWSIGRNDCTWPTSDLVPIYRDYSPHDLAPLAARAGVGGTVLVQTQPSDRDTDFILKVASENDLVKAVVGWVDLKSPAAPQRIVELARHPKLRGLRPPSWPCWRIGSPSTRWYLPAICLSSTISRSAIRRCRL